MEVLTAEADKQEVKPRHPAGLYVCFFTEMWERFSFYGLKALLIFYLTQHFLFSDTQAANIFGNYFALVYALPVIGGVLADKYLGFRKAVTLGGVLLCFGHLGMAFEGSPAYIDEQGVRVVDEAALQVFYLSLSLIIVGVGLLKPNISSIVGKLYGPDDPRRDSGFTLFYMGINLGSAMAAIACGYLGQTYGWSYGFGLAGLGMLLGLVVFLKGQKHLHGLAEPQDPQKLSSFVFPGLRLEWSIYLGALALVAMVTVILPHHGLVGGLLGFTCVLAAAWLVWFCVREVSVKVREQLYAAVSMVLLSVVFFLCFEQSGSSMNLFADRLVDREFMGMTIPASMFQSLNAIFIIMLAPVFAWLWRVLASRGWEPSTPMKFFLGLLQVGLGFGALIMGLQSADSGQVAMWWLVLAYLLHTTGELCLSPIGLSMITKLSAPRIAGLMMGVWFLGSAAAEFIAALLAGTAIAGEGVSQAERFSELYWQIMWIALAGALIALLMTPKLKRWMHKVH